VLLTGKALGGGVMPVSVLVATPDVFAPFDRDPLLHTSTFGGNPLAAAAALAALETIRDEAVPARAAAQGARLRAVLDDLMSGYPDLFAEVTGRGALLGLHRHRPEVAGRMIRASPWQRVLVTPCIMRPATLRLTPSASSST
jgi:putrescine aminotransferase